MDYFEDYKDMKNFQKHGITNNSLFGEEINFIGLHDLIRNKTATNRPKDRYDVLELEKIIALVGTNTIKLLPH